MSATVCLQKTCGRQEFLVLQVFVFYDDVEHISYGEVCCIMSILGLSAWYLLHLNLFPFYLWFFFNIGFTCSVLCYLFSLSISLSSVTISLEIKLSMLYMLFQMASSLCFHWTIFSVGLAIAKLLGWEKCVYRYACFQILCVWLYLCRNFHPECWE